MHHRNKAFKKKDALDWEHTVMHHLSKQETKTKLKNLREYFDKNQHGYIVELKFYFPEEILFTKKGHLSSRAHDLTNVEKPLVDLLFLPCYFEKKPPYGCENLNIDDKYLIRCLSEKQIADTHRIDISIEIVDLTQQIKAPQSPHS